MEESLKEILEKLRSGEFREVDLDVDSEGKVKRITLKPNAPSESQKEITDSIKRVHLDAEDLKGSDLSKTNISGNLSGMDLKGTDFSYARIERADMSGANLEGASFDKAVVTQTDMKNSYSVDMRGAYLTGSVDLYGVQDADAVKNMYKESMDVPKTYRRYDHDRALLGKKSDRNRYGGY